MLEHVEPIDVPDPLEHIAIEQTVYMNITRLSQLLLSDESSFFKMALQKTGHQGVMKVTQWTEEELPRRTITFSSGNLLGGRTTQNQEPNNDTKRIRRRHSQLFDFGTEVVHEMKYKIKKPGGVVLECEVHYGGDVPYAQWFNLKEQLVLCMVDNNKTIMRLSHGLAMLAEEKSNNSSSALFGKMFQTTLVDSITKAFSKHRNHMGKAFVEVLREVLILENYCRSNQVMQMDKDAMNPKSRPRRASDEKQHNPKFKDGRRTRSDDYGIPLGQMRSSTAQRKGSSAVACAEPPCLGDIGAASSIKNSLNLKVFLQDWHEREFISNISVVGIFLAAFCTLLWVTLL